MKRAAIAVVAFALAVLGFLAIVSSPARGQVGKKADTKEAYSVVQVDDEFRVVKASEVTALKSRIESEYKAALKRYEDAKREARKSKTRVDLEKPKKSVVRVIEASVPTEEEANRIREEHVAKKAKAAASKAGRVRYVVVRMGELYQVMTPDEARREKKALEEEHKRALRDYAEAKKAAAKEKKKFDRPRPVKKDYEVLGSPFDSKEKAQEFLEKMKEKEKKKA
jgi:hypothetical protein